MRWSARVRTATSSSRPRRNELRNVTEDQRVASCDFNLHKARNLGSARRYCVKERRSGEKERGSSEICVRWLLMS